MMIIESMDRDSKIRRLSPIAVLGDAGSGGYIDLVNGPQDHSCCSGYTCAERLSTFFTMVATGHEFEVVMSSIPPQNFKFHLLHNGDSGDAVRVKMFFPKQQRLDIYTEGNYIAPMNKDFSVIDGHQLFPPDDKYIPALTDNNCMNYFDVNTGHLYLIIKGPATCDIKTQPVVILKLGITVDEAEFFNPDSIVANIAGLLGIPAANIRVTNIVREGSTGRRKRSAETVNLQFEIAPAPAEELDEQNFTPEVVTYTTPADPNVPTQEPSYTTTTSTTARPLPSVDPLAMDYEALREVQSIFTTTFQSGALDAVLNVTVTEVKTEDPIPEPKEPTAYTSPEERAQVLETTYAEQSAAEDAAQLEELTEEKTLDVPANLVVGRQPFEAEEMSPLVFYPFLYTTNSDNEQLSTVGNEADPWRVTATLVTGPEGATIQGTLEVPIIKGFANFDNLLFSQEGEGYVISFAITYPDTVNIDAVESISVSVGPRPLGVKFDHIDRLVPNMDVLNASFSIWDKGLDQAATPDVLGGYTWQCKLQFTVNIPVLMVGNTVFDITEEGANSGLFDVRFEGAAIDAQFMATCESTSDTEDARTLTGTSDTFTLFPGTASSLGLLRKTSLAMTFTGPASVVQPVIDSFNSELGSLECEGPGCPASDRRRKRRQATLWPKFNNFHLDLAKLDVCSMPVCIEQDMSCSC